MYLIRSPNVYGCVVINDAGVEFVSTTVYINPYFTVKTAENIFAQISTSIRFKFKLMSDNFEKLEEENTSTLMFPSVDFSDFGTYQCDVTTDLTDVTITKFFLLTSKFK